MKKTLFAAALLSIFSFQFSICAAQQPEPRQGRGKHHRPDITELVSDLTDKQKRSIDAITAESKERVAKLRAQQKAVRDSIAIYMDREGDQSKSLHPLFDREARLQSLVSREMYATKVRVDELLTPAQRQQLKQSGKKRRGKK